jgi:multidrug resistance efflux pump
LRLLEISTELTRLNETLRNELSGSRQNSAELQTMLETSKTELDLLKRDLEPLRTHSTELLITAVNSQRELNGLKTALKQAETSLRNSELSWSAYRSEAEQRIRRLERNKRWYAGLLIGSLTAAAAGWTAFALGR